MSDPFEGLPRKHFATILADPPWRFNTWNKQTAIPRGRSSGTNVSAACHYKTMTLEQIAALPVRDLAEDNSCLFLWTSWPMLPEAMWVMGVWGFEYKTCGFDWMKCRTQMDLFKGDALIGMGYWTRANTEPCLLGTRGAPKRKAADVSMAIMEPRREHSRKPDCVRNRIERLVDGPYLELFSREPRDNWTTWGDEANKFAEAAE